MINVETLKTWWYTMYIYIIYMYINNIYVHNICHIYCVTYKILIYIYYIYKTFTLHIHFTLYWLPILESMELHETFQM